MLQSDLAWQRGYDSKSPQMERCCGQFNTRLHGSDVKTIYDSESYRSVVVLAQRRRPIDFYVQRATADALIGPDVYRRGRAL